MCTGSEQQPRDVELGDISREEEPGEPIYVSEREPTTEAQNRNAGDQRDGENAQGTQQRTNGSNMLLDRNTAAKLLETLPRRNYMLERLHLDVLADARMRLFAWIERSDAPLSDDLLPVDEAKHEELQNLISNHG